ncbi:alpha/beta hydrolase family protein [Glycomyces algeriensis]|uniref:Acyl-peptide hydrolase n=1 Tax=Glycomyces algeriensis TaxID=256037 RepID=A0A9W6GBA0_9ACTN|nr:prolyl oligopeptidase family serine peptidase [Glycomyces algeriensis]MDA1365467.1 prolyl oligopeptidase family serine peptidase [Glycomyces algeriensis]MDR7351153.1 dipeptidyl aminopeptidase/acylaminoacyl peptidase [Glycomyces algeriensis]GLI43866.1 acyl-peptide hydrolase [Glycomyces algeriensis]
MVQQSPYGAWESPITVDMVAAADGRPGYLGAVGSELWWTEPRPDEGGRRALMRLKADGTVESVLPAPWNVRNRVHEYGGRPWAGAIGEDGSPVIVFTNFDDQRLYVFEPDRWRDPLPVSPAPRAPGGLRWSDPVVDMERFEAWAVMEEHTGPHPTDVRRVLASVDLTSYGEDARVRELTDDSYRFLTGPKVSADGGSVAWIAWNHPHMPWDETELRVAEVTGDGKLIETRTVAGGGGESIAQVEWSRDNTLVFASDRTGWWNLHWIDPLTLESGAVHEAEAEFAGPMWDLGKAWFGILASGDIAAVHGRGEGRLGVFDAWDRTMNLVEGPWTEWAPGIAAVGDRVYGLAASAATGYEVVEVDTMAGTTRVVAAEHKDTVDPTYYPVPEHRTFTGVGGREIHAHVYPPRNPEYEGSEGELPPYAVWVHGGPTSHVRAVLDMELAYFTSRGIGVVEVNYGGSTGYGREYRERLRERWGEVDVEDCAAVARALAAEGTADPARIAIRGGSAGGWTAAASLTSPASQGVYACAVVKYPILDLSGWTGNDTHDFESQYVYSLVGPPEVLEERSAERSPVHHADRIEVPFILLQGLEDEVCPPAQAEKLLQAVAGRGVPHAYRTYEGEQHGFRRDATIVDAVLAEHALYAEVFAFPGPDFDLELRP